MRYFLLFVGIITSVFASAQDLDKLADQYARMHFDLLKELLSIPNDAHFAEHVEQNVAWCERAFDSRSFKTTRLLTEGPPLLLAERKSDADDAKTVLIYLQIDGQPVDPEYWFQDDPYVPALKIQAIDGGWEEIPWERIHGDYDPDWRVFARSTADAKGPVSMFLAAIDAIDDLDRSPDFNMKVIMDFEEEEGSPHLPGAVTQYREALASDMLIIFDGPRHNTNQPTLSFGARGISTITLTVYGPVFPQHSGHYGNYCPNPALGLSQLIASMKDADGVVTIPGYYDGIVIDAKTMEILNAVPDDERTINARLGISSTDKVASSYQESLQYPSLNVRGMSSGWVGDEVRTIVPSTAIAEIDIRLVKESDPDRLIGLVRKHIEDMGYHITSGKPTKEDRVKHKRICKFESTTSYLAFRTDFDSDVGIWLTRALTNAFGSTPIRHRTSGGSIPISPFVTTLNIPAVGVPTVNRDNNQHSPNENLRLGNYVDGIKTIIGILLEPLNSTD
jgi:acetylornithine deacetylase/succinyl-diaminopimelate desuccinylase-like protein